MKKTIIKFLVIVLTFHASTSCAAQMEASDLELIQQYEKIEDQISSGEISPEQYDQELIQNESGGQANQTVINPERDQVEVQTVLKNQGEIKDISSATTVEELQTSSEQAVAGYGQWAFEFIFIDKKTGTKKTLSSYKALSQIRPGSTQKLFTSWLAFQRGTYNLRSMEYMLRYSDNTMADAALRSLSRQDASFTSSATDYINKIIGHKMWDSYANDKKGAYQIIDKHIARGAGILLKNYATLENSSIYHPVNGSGLQDTDIDQEVHRNIVTPRLEISLLNQIYRSDKFASYKKMLPSPGTAGTLRDKFPVLSKKAKVYAKTGTLGAGKALAGFIETKTGTIVFSVIGDSIRGVKDMAAAHDKIIETVVYRNAKFVLDRGL